MIWHLKVAKICRRYYSYCVDRLKERYPYSIYWEIPYPNNKSEKCDLALLSDNSVLKAMIEFKIWVKNDDVAIRADIDKLKKVEGCDRLIFVIGYGGDIEEN